MFYNVENLFDTEDDPLTNDKEFQFLGARHWTYRKLTNKINRIYQVVMAAGEGKLPAVIGFCEIENRKVLELLLAKTPLEKLGYKIIHKESPDPRGIDVALIYNKNQFLPIEYNAITVSNPEEPTFKTRDILYAKGLIGSDTLHFFVNHWPSKYGGILESEPNRFFTAKLLRHKVDSLLAENENRKIILMGDFNDNPFDESIAKHLKAKALETPPSKNELYNLAQEKASQGLGSHKFQENWDMIDQMIVSGSLLIPSKLHVDRNSFTIFSDPFLLEKDNTHLGDKPFRTYMGFRYHNGYSDHLPVVIDLYATD